MPGLGHLVAGRIARAALFAVPAVLLAGLLAGAAISAGPVRLGSLALDDRRYRAARDRVVAMFPFIGKRLRQKGYVCLADPKAAAYMLDGLLADVRDKARAPRRREERRAVAVVRVALR